MSVVDDIIISCTQDPGGIATASGGRTLTRRVFLERAQDFAAAIRRAGVPANAGVCIALDPSPDLLIAMVGTWISGCSFIPIDPIGAPVRQRTILRLSQSDIFITQVNRGPIDSDGDTAVAVAVALMEEGRVVSAEDVTTPKASAWPDEAYVIVTSGTTGDPKGVSVSKAR